MTTIKNSHGCMSTVNYHPEVPFLTRPKIRCEKWIEGVKYYLGWNRKLYRAEEFIKTFG